MPLQHNIVRAGALEHFAPLVRSLDGDPARLLDQAGIDIRSLADPDRYLPYRNVLRAIESGASALGVPDFGLRLAASQDLSFLGTLWLAIQGARSVRDGLLIAGEHLHFHTPGLAVELRKGADESHEEVALRFLLDGLPPLPQATEHAISHMCELVRVLSDGALAPAAIHLRHAPVAARHLYRAHLGQIPVFKSSFDGISIDAVAGRRSLPRQNDQLHTFVDRYLIGAAPRQQEPLADQVRQTLNSQMRLGPANLVTVASVLRLHPRTLQRRLLSAGQTFEVLKDAARREFAIELLARDDLGLSLVAQLLDFADQSVLTRACRRWFDQPPSAVRRTVLGREKKACA